MAAPTPTQGGAPAGPAPSPSTSPTSPSQTGAEAPVPRMPTLAETTSAIVSKFSEPVSHSPAPGQPVEGMVPERPETPQAPSPESPPATSPEPAPQTSAEASPETTADPVAALTAQITALTALVERMITAPEAQARAPEPEPPRSFDDRFGAVSDPHQAQVIAYFGDNLPAHLGGQARDAFAALSGWQPLLDHAEHGAKARQQVELAQRQLAAVEFEATRIREQTTAQQAWSAQAKYARIDEVLAQHAQTPIVEGLSAQDLAGILMAVPAGTSLDEWSVTASQMIMDRVPAQPIAPTAPQASTQPASAPKNPANVIPLPTTTSQSATPWPEDRLPTLSEVRARARGAARGE